MFSLLTTIEREHSTEIVLHAHDRPPALLRLVESGVQPADGRVAIVGPLAIRVVVMQQQAEAWPAPGVAAGPARTARVEDTREVRAGRCGLGRDRGTYGDVGAAGARDARVETKLTTTPRLGQLLKALLLLALFGPSISELRYGYGVVLGLTMLVLVASVHAIGGDDRRHRFALALAIPTGLVTSLTLFIHVRWLIALDHALLLVFLALLVKVVLDHVMGQRDVSEDLIRAGLVVYLLVGLWFADVYALLELVSPGSFDTGGQASVVAGVQPNARVYSAHFIYFSLVTLTTLGFGDITPVSTLARSFSAVEAVIGPVFLAVFIGQLVGIRVAQASRPDDD